LAAAIGCTALVQSKRARAPVIRTDQFVIVTTQDGDTLPDMARVYLNDVTQWPRIAAYNRINAVSAGQRLVIPLKPTVPGGLSADGYQTVPILLYSHIKREPDKSKGVPETAFERQMQHLKTAGFATISLDQFYGFLQLSGQLPDRAAIVCFESADRWVFDIGFPILQRQRLRAALFVPVDQIDQPGKLTWNELSQMAAGGIEIGVLGKRIVLTPGKDPDKHWSDLEREIVAAKKAIELNLNPVGHYFAYPDGNPDDLTVALLKKHGFRLGFTRQRGGNPFFVHDFAIRRTLIAGSSSMRQFQNHLMTFRKARFK
jgi:peptidoglycan/xylan/chitin deacetylase (PgdA/CDA1 family)